MGNHDYDPDLLRALDDLDLPGVPVEKGEWDRVLASARGQVNAKQPGRKARRSRPLCGWCAARRWRPPPVWWYWAA